MGSCVTWMCNKFMKMYRTLYGGVHATHSQLSHVEVVRPDTTELHRCGSELVFVVHVPPPLGKCRWWLDSGSALFEHCFDILSLYYLKWKEIIKFGKRFLWQSVARQWNQGDLLQTWNHEIPWFFFFLSNTRLAFPFKTLSVCIPLSQKVILLPLVSVFHFATSPSLWNKIWNFKINLGASNWEGRCYLWNQISIVSISSAAALSGKKYWECTMQTLG